MDFAFSEEQEEFRETLRRFFAERVPLAEVRRMAERPGAVEPAFWKALAGEMGLAGIHLPEALGGQGFGFLELGIALEEMGRALVPGPFLGSAVLATGAVRHAASEAQRKAWLPALASGAERAALAWVEAGSWEPEAVALEARVEGGEARLEGVKRAVVGGDAADWLVVAARLPGTRGAEGLRFLRVDAAGAGVRVETLSAMDVTRPLARVELDGARGELLGAGEEAAPALRRTLLEAAAALSAEAVGCAQRCLDMAVAYAKDRIQFARPIGSFQAVQHKAAEVLLELELARSASSWALWVADGGGDRLEEAAPLAKSVCTDTAILAAAENVQIHGGLGFTWEHDAHLFLKRAKGCELLLGDATHQRRALARELGL